LVKAIQTVYKIGYTDRRAISDSPIAIQRKGYIPLRKKTILTKTVIRMSMPARGQYPSPSRLTINQTARTSKMPSKIRRITKPLTVAEGWLGPGSPGVTAAAVLLIDLPSR
jgi:hypothetical protein